MSWLNGIRQYFFQRHLRRELQKQQHAHGSVSFEAAKHIGILFLDGPPEQRAILQQYQERLRKQGKTVRILAFLDDKNEHSELPFRHFNRKHLNWAGIPQGSEVRDMIEEPFDILVNLYLEDCPALEYLSTLSKAKLRIGPKLSHTDSFDLIIDGKASEGLRAYIGQIDFFLKIFKHPTHEVAAV